MTGFYEIRIS